MTYAEKRAQCIAAARAGDLKPLYHFVEQLRCAGMGMSEVGSFDYDDTIAFLTHKGECTECECEDWFYEMDRRIEEMETNAN